MGTQIHGSRFHGTARLPKGSFPFGALIKGTSGPKGYKALVFFVGINIMFKVRLISFNVVEKVSSTGDHDVGYKIMDLPG